MSAVPWNTPPTFQTGQPLSYADVNLLWANALTLDSMSLKGRRAWTDQAYELDQAQLLPSPVCRASFMFRTGLTTLTIVAYGTNTSSDAFKLYLNGSLISTTSTTGADQTITTTLTGRGYTDRQIIEVDIEATRASQAVVPTYAIRDAYVSPASAIVGSSPGVPTFGAISQGNMQQLADMQQWLFDRMNACAMPVPQGQIFRPLHFEVSTKMMWRGSIARANGAGLLQCAVGWRNTNTAAERVAMLISTGGAYTEVATTPTIGAGEIGSYTFSVDLSGYTNEARLYVRLDQIVSTAYAQARGKIPTLWSMRWVETTNSGWTYTTPLGLSAPRESMTFSTLQTRLNSIGSSMSAVASRISGSTDMWDRIRLFRRSPTLDDYQMGFFKLILLARSRRFTDGIYLRGKNITIGYGSLAVKPELQSGVTVWEPQWAQNVISGDSIQDKYVGLDSLPGFVGGMLYYIYGEDLRYAAEVWQ